MLSQFIFSVFVSFLFAKSSDAAMLYNFNWTFGMKYGATQ